MGSLFNLCRSGYDKLVAHEDPGHPIVASVSLGEARDFRIISKVGKEHFQLTLRLTHGKIVQDNYLLTLVLGSLLIMTKDVHQSYLHALLSTTRTVGPRINISFRSC